MGPGGGGPGGYGTVFKLAPPANIDGAWTETVLHSFVGDDGSQPLASLIFDKSGALYGTTYYGAADGYGIVFKLTPPVNPPGGAWTESLLHTFTGYPTGNDGAYPYGSLIFDKSGALYGTTSLGGADGYGTVFKLTP